MELSYEIKRSAKRRTLTISVERDCAVFVHAPQEVPVEVIRRAVEAKRQWILGKIRHPQKYRELPHPPGKELVSGESVLYLGQPYRIDVTSGSGEGKAQFSGRFLVSGNTKARRRARLRSWFIDRAKEKILPRVSIKAKQLGVTFAKAKIVEHRYRWGSCTVKNNVHFNWRLIKAPMFVIEYVIAHELAHLIEPNHTARFWNIIRADSPAVERARKWLRENGEVLEQDL